MESFENMESFEKQAKKIIVFSDANHSNVDVGVTVKIKVLEVYSKN